MPMSAGMLCDRWDSCRERLKYGPAYPYLAAPYFPITPHLKCVICRLISGL